jgi:hypothetical protein
MTKPPASVRIEGSPAPRVTTVLPDILKTAAIRLCKGRMLLPVLQIITGILTGLASVHGWSKWWVCGVPWMVLNFPGIILSIPVITSALLTAGIAGYEWRTQSFFLGWFIAAPTVLSVIFGLFWSRWKRKRSAPVKPGALPARR